MSLPMYTNVTILNGGTTSTTYETRGANRGSFQMPATMTGTATTINVSNDGVNFTACPVLTGLETNPITTTGNGSYSFPVKTFNFRYLQLVSGGAEAAQRTITITTRD